MLTRTLLKTVRASRPIQQQQRILFQMFQELFKSISTDEIILNSFTFCLYIGKKHAEVSRSIIRATQNQSINEFTLERTHYSKSIAALLEENTQSVHIDM